MTDLLPPSKPEFSNKDVNGLCTKFKTATRNPNLRSPLPLLSLLLLLFPEEEEELLAVAVTGVSIQDQIFISL